MIEIVKMKSISSPRRYPQRTDKKTLKEMMNKILLLAGLLTIFSTATLAKQIDENTARQVGQTFLLYSAKTLKSSVHLDLAYKSGAGSSNVTAKSEPVTYFYVFNDGTNSFVIVAGDDTVAPILGYSDEGAFDSGHIPRNVQKWLEEYKSQIRYTIDNGISATQEIREAWTSYIQGTIRVSAKVAGVNPLIATKWDQSPHYNALCPGGSVTGCVATAMAQIMKYWKYPSKGTGFHSYNHKKYGTLSANFGSTTYQWSSMPNSVNSANNAVASLMYHCGVSVDMDYGPSSSGGSSAYTLDVVKALKTYFGYDDSVEGKYRSSYTDTQWIALLKSELDASRPVQYAGTGSGGGHSFVCDGYDNNNLFHFNWGWGGSSDGYFRINALNPGSLGSGGGSGGFNSNHRAIIGIKTPDGGTPQNYDLNLYSNISMSSNKVWYTYPFSLTVDIANNGTGNFSGQLGAAIFDHEFNFIDFMEIKPDFTLMPGYYKSLTFSHAGSTAFVPGKYHVSLFYKNTSRNWAIVGNGKYNNEKLFEVNYEATIEANSDFKIVNNGGKLISGSSATVNIDVINRGNNTFSGQFMVSLTKLNGSTVQSIGIKDEDELKKDYHYTNGLNFTGIITAEPGTYLMDIAFNANGSPYWYYAGSSKFSNPVYVIVEAQPLSPDQYEPNNTRESAYTVPVSFSGSSASKNTFGSNFHIGTDYDFYTINLPKSYNYTITARLHDSYNSGNGITYSVDGLFSYSTDNGSSWSDAYDDVMQGNITIQNGGTVYFHVAPYYPGETGTYLLDITINRAQTTGIDDIDISDLIKIYPNPAKDHVILDLSHFSGKYGTIHIFNNQGKIIRSVDATNSDKLFVIPLQGLANGAYFIQVQSSQGILTRKIIVSQ